MKRAAFVCAAAAVAGSLAYADGTPLGTDLDGAIVGASDALFFDDFQSDGVGSLGIEIELDAAFSVSEGPEPAGVFDPDAALGDNQTPSRSTPIPTPGAVALLAMGGVFAFRRRD